MPLQRIFTDKMYLSNIPLSHAFNIMLHFQLKVKNQA